MSDYMFKQDIEKVGGESAREKRARQTELVLGQRINAYVYLVHTTFSDDIFKRRRTTPEPIFSHCLPEYFRVFPIQQQVGIRVFVLLMWKLICIFMHDWIQHDIASHTFFLLILDRILIKPQVLSYWFKVKAFPEWFTYEKQYYQKCYLKPFYPISIFF